MNARKLTVICLVVLASFGCSRDERSAVGGRSKEVVIVISPCLASRTATVTTLTSWILHQAGARIRILDGATGISITECTVPVLNYPKEDAVAKRLVGPLRALADWIKLPPGQTNWIGTGTLGLPAVLDRLSSGSAHPPQHLVIVGSPVFRSADDRFDFATPSYRYPSLGHLRHPNSPFYSAGPREFSLQETLVYFFYPGEDTSAWPTHFERKLQEFYAALFAERGASLLAFTPDLDLGLKAVGAASSTPIHHVPSDPRRTDSGGSLEMIAAERTKDDAVVATVAVSDATETHDSVQIAADTPPEFADAQRAQDAWAVGKEDGGLEALVVPPPAWSGSAEAFAQDPKPPRHEQAMVGVTITIRYLSQAADADLYVRPHRDADELSFRRPETALGSYGSRIDLTAQEHVKWVHCPAGLEAGKAHVFLNYRSGFGRLKGEVIWATPDGTRRMPFAFRALKGGDATYRRDSTREASPHWIRLDLFELTSRADSTVSLSEAGPEEARGRTASPYPRPIPSRQP